MGRIWKVLTRKKVISSASAEETRLNRVLNVFDLTALGVGSTLGVGIYVLAGDVAKNIAGPSVVLSFLIAAIASVFSGLCYAEFGARAPRSGSAYIYSYVCVGELIAFIIGWNLILEYVIGSASVARGLSLYLDTLLNNTLQDTFREYAPINVPFMASYFDFFSFAVSIFLSVGLAFGLKESSLANNIVTSLNVLVVLFIIIAGSLKADIGNWRISPNNTNVTNSTSVGAGGFFPFGVEGMIKGAAKCFYGFVGFDCIATTGEEVKNPRKSIPISIIVSLFIIFLSYFGVSTVLTLMVPYYEQDPNAPIPTAFADIGWEWAKWIVAIGALFGLCASLFGAMFPLPRIIYAMGSDGLIFRFLAQVHPRFQTPVVGTILAGFLTGLMAALFDLSQLVNMMSIGTLQAYTIVAASVLLLRYNDDAIRHNFDGPTTNDEQELLNNQHSRSIETLKSLINCSRGEPNKVTEKIVSFGVLLYCLLCVAIGICAIYLNTHLVNGETYAIVITSIVVGLALIVLFSIATQPKSRKELSFKVPLVPLIPAASILINIYLMMMLDSMTWIRFAVWMAIGIPMYCICACSEKPLVNNYSKNKNHQNGNAKKSIGISNPTFVQSEERVKQTKMLKKKLAPPPPTIYEQKDINELQQEEEALAQLDEVIEKEVAISQLDDILNGQDMLNKETVRISDRKISDGDSWIVTSRSENVVADVHCANVVTLTTDPSNSCFPVNVQPPYSDKISITSHDSNQGYHSASTNEMSDESNLPYSNENYNISSEGTRDTLNNTDVSEELNIENLKISDDTTIKVSEIFENVQNSGNDSNTESNLETLPDNTLYHESEINILSNRDECNSPISEIVPILTKQTENTNLEHNSNSDFPSSEHHQVFPETEMSSNPDNHIPIPPEIPTISDNSVSESSKEYNKNVMNHETLDSQIMSTFPTGDDLKTVTLRHVKKKEKSSSTFPNITASNGNLRVGSEEYKSFIRDLDNKLKRVNAVPSFYVPKTKKKVIVEQKEKIPNENVIEESVNQTEAKARLKEFLEKNHNVEEPRSQVRILHGSKSVDESVLNGSTQKDVANGTILPGEDIVINPFENKMFNTLNLNKLETDSNNLKRRLSQSLGPNVAKPAEDKANHKVRMDDIFKSINLMRKDSTVKKE